MKIEIGEIENEVINWSISQLVIADNREIVITTRNLKTILLKATTLIKNVFQMAGQRGVLKSLTEK